MQVALALPGTTRVTLAGLTATARWPRCRPLAERGTAVDQRRINAR